jgi:RES domain-containing protein
VRLVATARLRDPVLHLLLTDPWLIGRPPAELDHLAASLAEIEGGTSARLAVQSVSGAIFPSGRPHANFCNAAFAYWRPRERNRFNDAGFGAWYAAFETETAMAEVTFHIGRELARTGDFNAIVDWAELWASFAGMYVDLRGLQPPPACLNPDIEPGYAAGNMVARQARAEGHNGIVYPSVRHAAGTCLVALWPHAVQSVTQGAVLRATWQGKPAPEISQIAQPTIPPNTA